jgi:hypothetical protein
MKADLERRRQHLKNRLALVERLIIRTEQRLRQLEVQIEQATPERAKAA